MIIISPISIVPDILPVSMVKDAYPKKDGTGDCKTNLSTNNQAVMTNTMPNNPQQIHQPIFFIKLKILVALDIVTPCFVLLFLRLCPVLSGENSANQATPYAKWRMRINACKQSVVLRLFPSLRPRMTYGYGCAVYVLRRKRVPAPVICHSERSQSVFRETRPLSLQIRDDTVSIIEFVRW